MTNEFALGPPVAFTEGMQGVQLTEVIRSAIAESVRAEPRELVFLRKLQEDRRGGACDVAEMSETIAAFADVYGSQLAGPIVHVAKKVLVYRLQVGEIETTFQGRL
jgi:hypothetical protein